MFLVREGFPKSILRVTFTMYIFGGNFGVYEVSKLLTADVSRLLSTNEGRNQYFH
jgi:hypothetical protein